MFGLYIALPCGSSKMPPLHVIESGLFALDGGHDLAGVSTRPELEIPNSLPRPGSETAIGDGDVDGGANKSGFDMGLRVDQYSASYIQREIHLSLSIKNK